MIIAAAADIENNAVQFIYCKVEKDHIREQEKVFPAPGGSAALIRQLLGLEIDLLITAALSSELETALLEAGIAVISGISGDADPILKEYLNGTLDF